MVSPAATPIQNPAVPIVQEKIEILSVDLLDQNRAVVEDLKKLAGSLRLEFGWHYLLDLTWAIHHLGSLPGRRIIDAGAGTGIMQWYLAQNGAHVYSVDRLSRSNLPLRFRRRFNVQGLRSGDLLSDAQALSNHLSRPIPGRFSRRWAGRLLAILRDLSSLASARPSAGSVVIYNQDLSRMDNLSDNSVDAAVAISSLEHNTPEGLEAVVSEIMRVLKPGGTLIATLTAAPDYDLWHAASGGWCYTDASLRRLFHLPEDTPSNYAYYEKLFAALKDCAELRDHLARFYSQSDDKGMPKGVWNPEYQPVGVIKIKR